MKKLIILAIPILLLCGCEKQQENKYSEGSHYLGDRFTIYTDAETCVEYFVSDGNDNTGNVLPRYNQDGTLKLNKKCLENIGDE